MFKVGLINRKCNALQVGIRFKDQEHE